MEFDSIIYNDPLRSGDGEHLTSNHDRSSVYSTYGYGHGIKNSFIKIADALDSDSNSSYHTATSHNYESDDPDSQSFKSYCTATSQNSESDDSDSITSCNTMICHSTTSEDPSSHSLTSYDTMVYHGSDDQSIRSFDTMVCHSSIKSSNSVTILNKTDGNNSDEDNLVNYDAAVSLNTTLDDNDEYDCGLDVTIELNHLKPIKQVCFSETDVEIEPSVTWSKEELLAGREGPWADIAFANYEFKCRIEEEFEGLLSPVLKKAQLKFIHAKMAIENQQNSSIDSILV